MSIRLLIVFGLIPFLCACVGSAPRPTDAAADGASSPAVELGTVKEELEELTAPPGVDAGQFAALKAELARVLALRELAGDKRTSTPPNSDTSAASLTLDDNVLEWRYYNQGDYDQNGEVNIADLTPLAVHLGEAGSFTPDSIQNVVDGDGNGEINIADVTPIGANFRNSAVGGYCIYESLDAGNAPDSNLAPSTLSELASVDITMAQGTATAERLWFTHTLTEPTDDAYYWVRPVDGEGNEGTSSNLVQYSGGEPQSEPPIAALTVTPASGDIPMEVTLDASGSHDPDGQIVNYAFDWDGYGNGWEWNDNGDSPIAVHTYTETGTYTPTVRVRDNSGELDAESATVNATAPGNDPPQASLTADPTSGDAPLTVQLDASASFDPDGEIVKFEWDWEGDGTYEYDSGVTNQLQHEYGVDGTYFPTVRVTDDGAATDTEAAEVVVGAGGEWHVYTVLTENYSGYVSLALVAGKPAIAYSEHSATDGSLNYIPAEDALGTSWNQKTVLDSNRADLLKLCITAGNPAVMYMGFPLQTTFVRAQDPAGGNWGTPIVAAQIYVETDNYSMAVIDGNPAFGYDTMTPDGFYYHRANNPEGTSWADPAWVAEFGGISALLDVNGKPAFCLLDNEWDAQYIAANDVGGTSWRTPVPLNPGNDMGLYPTMTMVNGNPAVCFPDWDSDQLLYFRATDSTGIAWNAPVVISETLIWCNYPSLAVINNKPAVSFSAGDPNQLHYVSAADTNGAAWNSPEIVDSDVAWPRPSLAEINGHPGIAYLTGNTGTVDLRYVTLY